MPRQHSEKPIKLRQAREEWSPPLPVYHHPIIALSLILIIASAVQIVVWILSLRLLAPVNVVGSTAAVHGSLFDAAVELAARVTGRPTGNQPVVFASCLVVGLLSSVMWYAMARLAFGPAWGLWTSLCWATHPGFAFLAQRPSALVLVIFLVPAALAVLAWWRVRGMALYAAGLVGLGLGLLTLNATAGLLLLPVTVIAMLLAHGSPNRRYLGAAVAMTVYLGVALLWSQWALHFEGITQMQQRLAVDAWERISVDGLPISADAQAWTAAHPSATPHVLAFLLNEAGHEPLATCRWFAGRIWESLYSTADGRLQRPLFFLQLAWLLPAVWGLIIAVGFKPWRWMAITAACFAGCVWIVTALGEPLARNLTPVGGIPIVFALIGMADVYERIFHRRLTEAGKAVGASNVL